MPRLVAAALAVAIVLGVAASVSSAQQQDHRTEVSFDFGWRFRLGATGPPPPPPAPSPSVGCDGKYAFANASGVQCAGLQFDGASTPEGCATACCNDNACGVWQFEDPAVGGGGCWRGVCQGGMNPNKNWVGGARAAPTPPQPPPAPLPTNPPEAQPAYNDSTADWTTVNAPHDSLINAAPNFELCPDGCSGRSYIPRYPSW
jgi:hypothetical protein